MAPGSPRRFGRYALLALTVVACRSAEPPPEPPAARPDMARHQLFFAGREPERTLLAVVFQRQTDGETAEVEAKVFSAREGRWQTPFWERVEVDAWPGDDPGPAVEAWKSARGEPKLRLEWDDPGSTLRVAIRSATTAIVVEVPDLQDAGSGPDPHGRVTWRSGRGLLTVNDQEERGAVIVEALRGDVDPRPWFGGFEMWVLSPEPGTLVLGRQTLDPRQPGTALRVDVAGSPTPEPFEVTTLADRPDAETGFALPTRWQVGDAVLERAGGQTSRGKAPDGSPAVYDIGLATQPDGAAQALVFHLQDRGATRGVSRSIPTQVPGP